MIDPVERFLNYLTVEKGLAANTLEAYKRDILKFKAHLDNTGKLITCFERSDLISFINILRDSGLQATTLARHISAIRGLCRFFLLEGIMEEDPVENLSTPKGWKRIPRIIGIDEVSELLRKPEGKELSLRDRAMLEIIYSSGFIAFVKRKGDGGISDRCHPLLPETFIEFHLGEIHGGNGIIIDRFI